MGWSLLGLEDGSRPTRGAWIETYLAALNTSYIKSRPTRGAWIETMHQHLHQHLHQSRPTRGAWIETGGLENLLVLVGVAPHTGRVD